MADISDKDDADTQTPDEKLLEEAKARFALAEQAESNNRRDALEDLEFLSGKQWHDADERARREDGRPCLTINKLPQVVNQVTNDQRQNRPAIKVDPVDDQGDVETAKVMQGLIRHIEYNSNAEAAYDTAFEFAAKMGWGYYRIITQYADETSFDQDIIIKRIPNPFSVYFDPHSVEPDGSDANYVFVTEDMSKDEFKRLYPKSELAKSGTWESSGDQSSTWIKEDSCRVAEYFYKETKSEEIVLLSNGQAGLKSKLPEDLSQLGADDQGQPITVVKERTTDITKIQWVKINGEEILEQTEWLGKYIPVVPVYGSDSNINGNRVLKGIVRDAKDSARMYNYFASAESEAVALAPKAPFLADPKQIEGFEPIWQAANRKNFAYLPYNMVVDGVQGPVPPPQRSSSEVSTQAITQARMLASDDLKATTGIYDASLGNKSNETSGVAIQRRNVQAQTSNFHFMDNLTRSLRHTGRILIDLIPKVYDTARTARIVAEDGEQRVVKVNQPFKEENGNEVIYALDAGKYDVTVDVGPSFQSKRQEAAQNMIELSKTIPALSQAAPDMIVKMMDFNGAQELSERLKKTLPPNLLDDGKQKQGDIPPQVKQQMDQMGQMVQQLTSKLHEAHDVIDNKRVELESRERIEFKKLEVELQIEMAKLDAKDAITMLNAEMDSIKHRMSLIKYDQPFDQDQDDQAQPQLSQPQPPMDGGPAAAPEMGNEQPTGGLPPGSPMEGN